MKKLIFFGFLFLNLTNCNDGDNDPNATDCIQVACTEEFVTLVVTVTDSSGAAVVLDTFEVIDKESAENITIATNDSVGQDGKYPLYNDSFVSENQNTQRTLVFRGFINNEKVAEAEYVVITDCCHVSLTSGDANITSN